MWINDGVCLQNLLHLFDKCALSGLTSTCIVVRVQMEIGKHDYMYVDSNSYHIQEQCLHSFWNEVDPSGLMLYTNMNFNE